MFVVGSLAGYPLIKQAMNQGYDVAEFMRRSRTALTIASDRVREKYGFACSRAMGQLARLEAGAKRFDATSGGVTVTSFQE